MKKKFLLILMGFMTYSGFAQLDEGFESAPATPDASGVWTMASGNWLVRDNRTNSTPNWEINPPAVYPAHTGTKAAFINRENTGAGVLAEEWLITPLQNIGANRQLRFFTRQTLVGSPDPSTLYQVRVSSDPDQANLGAFTTIVEYTEAQLSEITPDQLDYEEKIVNLGFTGDRYFAFVKVYTQPLPATSGDRWLIDDVKIVERCLEPTNFGVSNVSAYNATLEWDGNATQYTIEYGQSGFEPGTGTIITGITGTSYTIPLTTTPPGPLSPDTPYQFYVTAVCAESSSLQTGPFNFTTSPLGSTCDGPIVVTPLPYSDSGDTLQQGNNIDAPSPGSNCGGTGDYLAGNDVVYAYTVPATTTGLISIEMNPLANSDTGVFVYANCSDIGSNCIAGVANGNGNIRSIPALAVTAGETIYIVVSSTSDTPTFQYNILIQNVTCAPPTGLSATGTGPNSANLSWQNPGNATSWEVFVQEAGGLVPGTPGITAGTNVNFGVTQLTAEGTQLVLGTPYQYWVRALCPDGVSFSQWAGPYLFNTTSCSSGCNYTFDMTDTFGDGWNGNTISVIQDGLTIATLGPTFEDGEGPVTVSVPLCDGPFTLFWNLGGSFPGEIGLTVTNSFGQVIFVKEPLQFSQGSEIFAGTVDCANPLCLPPTEITWSNVVTDSVQIAWVPNGPNPLSWDIYVVEVGSAAPDENTTPTLNTTSNPVTVGSLDPDTEYVIYIRAVCAGDGDNPWSDPSEPFQTLPTCPRPTQIVTSNADLTSITLDWTPGLNETQWEYIFVNAGDPIPADNDPNWIPTSTHPVNITTGLTQATAYDFYVRAICSADDISTPGGPTTGNTTVCPASQQCPYVFTLTDSFGDGWNGNTMSVLQNGIVVATFGDELEDGFGPIEVQVPLCHGVNFELLWNEGGNFPGEVGVSITNFLGDEIYTLIPFTQDPGDTLYSGTAECTAPTCLVPTEVIVTSTSLTTATIQWTDNNTPAAGSWDILILPSTAQPPAQDATGWVNVTTNPFVYEGLTAATTYTVYVRSVCSDPDKSFWSMGHDFSTQLCEPANVCDYTFIMTDSFGDGWNGNTMTILQGGIPVATIGADFTDGEGPIETVVTLCNNLPFEVFWNEGGAFAAEVGLAIENATGDQIFSHEPGDNLQGETLFSGTVNCIPATCPKPVQLNALNITTTSAQLSWTEAGTATQWEVFILPAGSPAPDDDDMGIITSNNPYTATLTSGTAYVFYVVALCSDDDHSNPAGPKAFSTLITNDECDAAVNIPVNPDQSCALFASGTITGATASDLPNDCGGTADDDVWFSFQAATSAHNINISNIGGSTEDLFHIVYQGDNCGNMTQVYCSDANTSVATGLVPGQTYFVRVFSWTSNPGQTSTFDICIGTIPPPISSSTTSHTNVQLIEDVLLNTTCASVSNVTSSTGINFGSTNGIGYFERNGSSFPFDYGVVLTTGNADSAPGPNTSNLGEGDDAWPGDPDLTQVLADAGIPTGTLANATSLEFDFVPLTNNISFDFIFASEEYGTFQCGFSDVFAFLLTDTSTNVTTNLAVVPNTTIPISVTTIRNNLYNGGCDSANEAFFAAYYEEPEGNPLEAPINFNGVTVPMTATAPVTPGVTYHIKLAIADYTASIFGQDNVFDSAVFLKGGSFGIGNIELGDNLLEENGGALCEGGSITLNSSLDPVDYTFTWDLDGEPIPNAFGSTLTVTEEGEYTVHATLNNSTCVGTDSVIVEYYNPVAPGQADALTICDSATSGTFDLTQNAAAILAPIGNNYTLTYFLTEALAIQGTEGAIQIPTAYTTEPVTIYVRATNNATGCFGVTSFELHIQDLTPEFSLPADFAICAGSSGTISVTPINFDLTEATYSWTQDSNPLPDTTSNITVTQAGFYEVTVNRQGCVATQGVTVTVDTQITPVFNLPTNICQNTTAPTLPTTSVNGVIGTWSPAVIDPGLAGTVNYCFTPDAGQTCAIQACINITVDPEIIPQFDPIGTLCVGTTAPTLLTTSLNGVEGTWNPAFISTGAPGTFPFEFTPNAGQACALVYNMTVTVLPAGRVPQFQQLGPICSGANLTLPTVSQENITGSWTPAADNTQTTTYTFQPDGGQCAVNTTMTVVVNTTLNPGFDPIDAICQFGEAPSLDTTSGSGVTGTWNPSAINTQTAGTSNYTFTPDAGQCATAQTLSVTIIPQQEFEISSGCVGNNYVLTAVPGSNFGNDVTYTWTDGQGVAIPGANESSLIVTATGSYGLTVSSGNCSAFQDIMVTTVSCVIQKGISPGDGSKNDFFDLAGLNVRRLEIFNRYGTKVYSQANYSREWYGQSDKGDELPDGTYWYVIERDSETKTGWIYINRVK